MFFTPCAKTAAISAGQPFTATLNGTCACYQYFDGTGDCHRHYHLKCLKCGKLLHAECEFLNDLSEHIEKEHDFVIDGEKTVLYGICGECRRKD